MNDAIVGDHCFTILRRFADHKRCNIDVARVGSCDIEIECSVLRYFHCEGHSDEANQEFDCGCAAIEPVLFGAHLW